MNTTRIDPERVDLQVLSKEFEQRLRGLPPSTSYLEGKTEFRAWAREVLGCSVEQAEHVVDTMERRNIIRFEDNQQGAAGQSAVPEWRVVPPGL